MSLNAMTNIYTCQSSGRLLDVLRIPNSSIIKVLGLRLDPLLLLQPTPEVKQIINETVYDDVSNIIFQHQFNNLCALFHYIRGVCLQYATEEMLARLQPSIRRLRICTSHTITSETLSSPTFSNLEFLQISGCFQLSLTHSAFDNMHNLTHLDLAGSYNIDISQIKFQNMQQLTYLNLNGCNNVPNLGILKFLTFLSLQGCDITCDCVFKDNILLEHLDLYGCQQVEYTPDSFSQLKNLKKLILISFNIDPAVVEHLKLRNLDYLGW